MSTGNRLREIGWVFLLTLALSLGVSNPLYAIEVSGVRVPDTAQVGDQTLQLNGAGIRYAAAGLVRVYVIGVYLPRKQALRDERAFDAISGAKRMQMHFLRTVDSNDFGRALMNGLRANLTAEERLAQLDSMARLGTIFGQVSSLGKGGVITVDRDARTGASLIYVNGKQMAAPFPDPGFFNALMKIWLGPKPVEPSLKPVLLGTASGNDNSSADSSGGYAAGH